MNLIRKGVGLFICISVVFSTFTTTVYANDDVSNHSVLSICTGDDGTSEPQIEHKPMYSEEKNDSSDDTSNVDTVSDLPVETIVASDLVGLTPEAAIEKVAPLCVDEGRRTGILPSVILAQFCVESGFGQSELAVGSNNIFGMKTDLSGNTWSGSTWDGIVFRKNTGEQLPNGQYITVTADFRQYASINDCIKDHSAYLIGAEKNGSLRYPGIANAKLFDDAISIINNGQYATSHTYLEKLTKNKNEYDLTKYDNITQSIKSNVSSSGRTMSDNGHLLVVIDAGHQKKGNSEKEPIGPGASEMKAKVTGGTSGVSTGLAEYELTLAVALKLEEELKYRGYRVLMVRTSNDVNMSNAERAQVANDAEGDIFIRLHANGSDNSSAQGAMAICQTASNPYNGELHDDSYALSQSVLDKLCEHTGAKKERIWETDTMTGINWCKMPTTIVEMGYMTNEDEDKLMATDTYQQKLAVGIANGIDTYFSSR